MFYFFYNIFFSFILSFLFSFFLGYFFIFYFNKKKIYQYIRFCIRKNHLKKKKIPTMGGFIMIFPILIISFFFVKLNNFYIFLSFLIFILNVIIGFLDDYMKVFFIKNEGLSIFIKYILQSFCSFIFIFIFCYKNKLMLNKIRFPIYNKYVNIGFFYPLFLYFVIIGCSNSVNLTDGLDGLVIFPLIFLCFFLFILSFISSNIYLSKVFKFEYFFYAKDIVIICSILLGSFLSFFFFNFYPARIFMGDVGSLSLGAFISSLFILLHQEIYLFIVGFLFVLEVFSVIIQIFFIYFFKKKIFLMAPFHHHFELLGFSEIRIVVFFWILSFLFFFIGFLILGVF